MIRRVHSGKRLQSVEPAFKRISFSLSELNGGLGDIGTFIPLAVSLITVCHLDAGALLFWAGLFNILTGLAFGIPIPVQPMKAIAAVAVAEGFHRGDVAAAGLSVGLLMLLFTWTGLLEKGAAIIPKSVIRGIQLGVGIKLIFMGCTWISTSLLTHQTRLSIALLLLGLLLFLGVRVKIVPAVLIVFCMGFLVVWWEQPHVWTELKFGWNGFHVIWPSDSQWLNGFLNGALPQLPLTFLNSIIAVCALSTQLCTYRPMPIKKTGWSIGLINMAGCLLGAMPVCHGSGGLAAQYRFGSRNGGGVIMVGVLKIFLGVGLGYSAAILLNAYPISILGFLLVLTASELIKPVFKSDSKKEYFVAGITGVAIVSTNTGIGFLLGLGCAWIAKRIYRT